MSRPAATSAEARYLEAGVQLLAQSATFRSACGAATPAAALAHIIESWGGHQAEAALDQPGRALAADGQTRLELPCIHGHVALGDLDAEETAYRARLRRGSYLLTLYLRPAPDLAAPDRLRLAWNSAGQIADEAAACFGTPGFPAWLAGGPRTELLLPEPDSAWRDYLIAELTLEWSS